MIAGDSLLVMNSLLEKEGMAGKVQMVYIDPPYGIRYGSNFQPFISNRNVGENDKDEDLTSEPEMIKAFRDTWELGIHSYLTYLRDRLFLVRELLAEDGSVFVQISDENVMRAREILDEVFGVQNFVKNPTVATWVKNDHLGFEILYVYRGVVRKYRPDFLICLTSGEYLVLETKGQDSEQDQVKRRFLDEWVKAVNQHAGFGRWHWEVSKNPADLPDILARYKCIAVA